MKTMKLFAGLASACLLVTSLGGCSTLGGVPGAGGNGAASFGTMVSSFNNAVASNCTGGIHVMYMFPAPPQGHIDLECAPHAIAVPASQPAAAAPAPAAVSPAK